MVWGASYNRPAWSMLVTERGRQGELFWWYRGTESKNRWDRRVVGYLPSSERFLSRQEKKPLTTAQLVFHLNCMDVEDDEWTHKSDTVGESKGGEYFRAETENTQCKLLSTFLVSQKANTGWFTCLRVKRSQRSILFYSSCMLTSLA